MHTGIDRRFSRMFAPDGRTVVLAFDHGNWGANTAGMANPGQTLTDCISAGADAVLTTSGQMAEFGKILERVGVAVNMDDFVGDPTPLVQQAVSIGADMSKIIAYTGQKADPTSVRKAQLLCAICRKHDLPVMVEPIPGSFDATDEHTIENIGAAGRIAAEIGATLVKLQYRGPSTDYKQAIDPIFRPTIVLGGANRGDARAVLSDVHDALQAGAVGIAIGRNIWAHETPARMIAAMGVLVHGGGSVNDAIKELE